MNIETEKLIVDNMKLVYFVISKYYPKHIGDEDLIQIGMLGLIRATKTFDESKGKFSTYACFWIRNMIRFEFRKRSKNFNQYSMDYEYMTDEGDTVKLQDVIVGDEDIEYIDTNDFIGDFGEKNNKIVELLEQGYKQGEIADIFGVSRQAISERVRRMKSKWRMKNGYTD